MKPHSMAASAAKHPGRVRAVPNRHGRQDQYITRDPDPAHRTMPDSLSAGILLYRRTAGGLRLLLAHPGGPYYVNRDVGAWSIPKGLVAPGEELEAAARREFQEELGWSPAGGLLPLGEVRLRSGKRVVGFAMCAVESEADMLAKFAPGTFTMEWPPQSGRTAAFPEVDRVAFFTVDEARRKLNPAQAALVDRLVATVGD